MARLLLLFCVLVFVAASLGCESSPVRSASVNTQVAVNESVRVLGLDRPSMLYLRDTFPINYYSPYR